MKKKLATLLCVGLMATTLVACGGTDSTKDTLKNANASVAAFNAKEAINIEDIDWSLSEAVYDGERYIAFCYTNNTDYILLNVDIEFALREDVTAEQLAVFDDLKERYDWTDEEVNEVFVRGYNRRMAEPGEYVADSPCVINDSYTLLESMEQYELMEPDMATISFVGPNDKCYVIYYDYRSQTYSEASESGISINGWSESEIAKLLPESDFKVVYIEADEEDRFWFYAYGQSRGEYLAYVDAVKANGFTIDEYEGSNMYSAENENGIKIDLDYSEFEEEMKVLIKGDLSPQEDTATETTAEEPAVTEPDKTEETNSSKTDATGIDPDFKAAMDSYEAFFDEYVDFMNEYMDADADDLVDMMDDYTEYMAQYTETMEKLYAIDADELTWEEAEYYWEVTLRIEEKLLEVY